MKIKTNSQERELLTWFDLTTTEQERFDYIEDESGAFFRYRGEVYDLGEFMLVSDVMIAHSGFSPEWVGYRSDSFFSGVLVRYSEDYEAVVVATYIS